MTGCEEAQRRILAGPDTPGKRFLLEMAATRKKQASGLPQDRQTQAGPTNSILSEPDRPEVPVGYKPNPEWIGENPEEPKGDLPF